MSDNIQMIGAGEFLDLARKLTVIDVRSPKEYHRGHIPGAVNIPLFNDLERGRVGATYHQSGQEAAILKGLEIAGPKMADIVKKARQYAKSKEILVHCWRGGMRSGSIAWLLATAGLHPFVLEGGYKAYRNHIRQGFLAGPPILVMGGMTGSGKTKVLQQMAGEGEQVIDLEGMARHKGSAYGSIGEKEQPSNEQFENELAKKWSDLDPERPVWLEDESLQIGKVSVPKTLFERMRDAIVVFLDIDMDRRIENLVSMYVREDTEPLKEMTLRISKRLGGLDTRRAVDAIDRGDFREAAAITLKYYDKAYLRGLSSRDKGKVVRIVPSTIEPGKIAREIIRQVASNDIQKI